jgi:predicted Zn-dependent protease
VAPATTPEEEQSIGRTAAATLLGGAPLWRDERAQRYVNRVGLWVALHSDRPELPWKFGILDNDNINAFAAPGGTVLITRGLLERVGSEAELAGVLGHEIAHITQRHHLKAITQQHVTGFLAGVGMAQLGKKYEVANDPNVQQLVGSVKSLYTLGLDRSDEYEADRLGVVFAARAGYDPYGLPNVLLTLDSLNPSDPALALLFKTHPRPATRLQELDARMRGAMDALGGNPVGSDRYRAEVRLRG